MSFVFPSWETAFSPSFHEDAKKMLEGALNKGNKPPVIQGRIEVVELSMGKQPPTLTLLEIGDLSLDRFRGILRLGYQGDAWIEVRCRVQANPLSHNPNLLPSSTLPLSTPLLASQPLLVPMTIRLSRLNLRAILILVVSASKGITLVFKNDPLQNVDVSSTFDSVEVIRGYLQQEIEGQLREMFREDLPGIIHRLSQQWLGGSGTQGKVELPYRDGGGDVPSSASALGTPSVADTDDELDPNDPYAEREIFPPHVPSSSSQGINISTPNVTPRRRALQQAQAARQRRPSNAVSESPTSYTVFPDIEDYDPTYGLRPEGVPTHSGYEAFGRLWEKARQGEGRGLGSLMQTRVEEEDQRTGEVSDEDWNEEDDDGNVSLDLVEQNEALRPAKPPPLVPRHTRTQSHYTNMTADEDAVEWETYPAVGGGVITRPRVFHSQSQIRAPSESGAMPSPGTGSVTARASSGGASSTIGSLRRFPYTQPMSPLTSPGLGQAGPGPSSLRRMATSRSDVFAPQHRATRSEVPQQPQPLPKSRNMVQSPSAPRTGTASGTGNSWSTGQPSRSNTMSTLASSQLPSSKSMSIQSKPGQQGRHQPQQQQQHHHHQRNVSMTGTSPGRSFPPRNVGLGGITLPLNNSVSQLATLSHSNHTLSPYARGHEHIAVRSFPHLGKSTPSSIAGGGQSRSSSGDGLISNNRGNAQAPGNVKARRKRMYRLGTTKGGKEKEKEKDSGSSTPLSPDLDNTPPPPPPPPRYQQASTPDDEFRRLSFGGSGPGLGSIDKKTWEQPSLTGMAQRVMRPNMARSPASRTSYGFPDTY